MNSTREIERRRLPLCNSYGQPILPEWLEQDRRDLKNVEELLHTVRLSIDPEIARKRRVLWIRSTWVGISITLAVLFMFKRGVKYSVKRVCLVPPDKAIYQWCGFYRVAGILLMGIFSAATAVEKV